MFSRFFLANQGFLRQLFAGSNTSQSVLCCVFTMAGLSTQEFLNCTHSPLEIVKADPQIKADPGSRVFCFLSCHNSSGKISNQVPG